MQNLLLLIFLIPFTVTGQTYIPFVSTPDSSDTWIDIHSCTDFSCFFSSSKRYNIVGDTTIGAYQYSKLIVLEEYEAGTDTGNWCDEYINYYNYYYGAIRENDKQIFINRLGTEYLAYDFNLSVGDIVPSPAHISESENMRTISSIDSLLVNGIYHKRFWINSGTEIIEGFGASSGLFNPVTYIDNCYSLMSCYSEYNSPQYFSSDCDLTVHINNTYSDKSPPELIKIIDCLGREIKTETNTLMIYIYSDGSSKKVLKLD